MVCDQKNGKLYRQGDVEALATILVWASTSRPALQAMGMRGRQDCEHFTHHAMHRKRHEILLRELALAEKE